MAEAKTIEDPKKRNRGPIKWCKKCSRRHGSRENCLLVAFQMPGKGAAKATRFIHVSRLELDNK